jgi:hypothetical protein
VGPAQPQRQGPSRRVSLGPRWGICGSPTFGRHPWVPAEKEVTVGPGSTLVGPGSPYKLQGTVSGPSNTDAALVAGINTDEYLYLNFTANAQRGILLYALDARFPRVIPPRRAWKVLQETLLKPNPLKVPSGLQKASFQTNLRLIAHKYCPRMLPSSTSPERDPSRLTLPSSIFESPSTRARYTYRIDTSTYKKLQVTAKRKSSTCTVSNVTSSRIRDRLNTRARVIITYNVYHSSFAIYPTREIMKIHLIATIHIPEKAERDIQRYKKILYHIYKY